MNMKPMDGQVLGDMPPADPVEASTLASPASADMPSGAMQAGETMLVDGGPPETSGQAGEMPGLAQQMGEATRSMPLGAMTDTDTGSAMTDGGSAAVAFEMPAGLMDIAADMGRALGNAASADATVMELSGQWRMSFWVSPKS